MGIGININEKASYKPSVVSSKIKELVSSTNGTPTFYALVETKMKASSKNIKLPRNMKYLCETSGLRPSGGILLFSDRSLGMNSSHTIASRHALFCSLKVDDFSFNCVVVYLPCDYRECTKIIEKIDAFLYENDITDFCIFGDFNIDFQSVQHQNKAIILNAFLLKHNLIDVALKLNSQQQWTWRGRGERINSKSTLDYFFCNFGTFNNIKFNLNSFSDHKDVTVSYRKQFIYHAPKWKSFLFKNDKFKKLMENEALSFLIKNAHESSFKFPKDIYHTSPTLVDTDLNFDHYEFKETSVFFNLLKHLKKEHDRFYSQIRSKNYSVTKKFNEQMSLLYDLLDSGDGGISKSINELINEQRDFFKNMVFSQAEQKYLKKMQCDGYTNAFTFKHIRGFQKNEYNLSLDGNLTNDPKKIAEHFAKLHSEIVNPLQQTQSDLNDFLKYYELSLSDIFPKIPQISDPKSTTADFIKVIKSMSNNSTPGISSEPKILFEFLIKLLPNFVTKALNNLYFIDIDHSPFAFIKHRNIVFIPKRGTDLSDPKNFRPISLLETVYKILSKALNQKIRPHLSTLIDSEQFGFMPQKHMSTASLSMTSTINHIKQKNYDAQLISFDFSKAFDRILPGVINTILMHIFPNGHFAKSLINLTNGGKFRALINGIYSQFIDIVLGAPQGDPFSGTKFNVINQIFPACLKSVKLKRILLHVGKSPLPPGSYADDNWAFFQMTAEFEVELLKDLLIRLKASIGLHVNFKKTKIITNGAYPKNLNEIGNFCNDFKHLGIYLSFDLELAAEKTYSELICNLDKKSKTLPMRGGYNLFKRRNLCSSLLNSMCYHVFRIFSPNDDQCNKIWKIMTKFLWTSKTFEGISRRTKISQNRIELNYLDGGLNLLKPQNLSFSVWITSFINALKHASLYTSSTLRILLNFSHTPIDSLLKDFSSKTFMSYERHFKKLYANQGGCYFTKFRSFLLEIEKDPTTFYHTPLTMSNWSFKGQSFSIYDQIQLRKSNLLTMASILEKNELKNKIVILPVLRSDLQNLLSDSNLYNKICTLWNDVKQDFSQVNIFTKKVARKFLNPLILISNVQPSIYSYHFKRMYRIKLSKPHPAIQTRKRDGLYFPDPETFFMSYKRIFQLPILLHHKNFFFEQFIRTLPSKNKLFKFKLTDTATCSTCNVISNTEHALFSCKFPKYFVHALALFLDNRFNDDLPQFIFLKENFYLFNIFYEEFSITEYIQITQLILISKDKSLKYSTSERTYRWNYYNWFSQSLLIAQFACTTLQFSGLENSLILEFHDFLLSYSDNPKYFDV